MTKKLIFPIVEGHSEAETIPLLLRKVFHGQARRGFDVAKPWRIHRTAIVKPGELERKIEVGVRKRDNVAGILLILDADDDCPGELGPKLLERCANATPLPTRVVLAKRELECWFLGAAESLRNVRGLRSDIQPPSEPEAVRGGKEWLDLHMEGRRYVEVDDQPALASEMDLELARKRCPSFDKFLRDVDSLLEAVQNPNGVADDESN